MNADITVVVPYYNEKHTVESTLEKIGQQSLPATCAIFVNSSSTDNTSDILDEWIEKNQHKYSTRFVNAFKNTSNPGSSKNVGIRHAKTEWIAFMDCGQRFEINWLEKQFNFTKKNNVDIVFGVVYLSGVNWVDRCAVAQTYGYKRNRPCVPSTLVKKSVFDKTGLFLEGRRSGYDMAWRIKINKSDINRAINDDVKIMYRGANFAPNITHLFRKSILYAKPALGLEGYFIPYYYMLFFILIVCSLPVSPIIAMITVGIYFFARMFVTPILKSHGIIFYKEHPLESFFGLGIVGLIIDTGKICGYFAGIKELIVKKYFPDNS